MRQAWIAVSVLLVGCGGSPFPLAPGDGGSGGVADPAVTPRWEVVAHHAPVMDLTWGPGESHVAVYARQAPLTVLHGGTGAAVDWRAGSHWFPPGCALLGAISWSPAGNRLALPGVVVDTETWTPAASLVLDVGHTSDALAFSPDGAWLAGGSRPASGGQAGCICLVVWDPATGEQVLALDAPGSEGYRGYISVVVWSPDGRRVATTSWSARAAVYDLAAGAVALDLPAAASVAWSPDGTRIALAHAHAPWVHAGVPGVVSVLDAVAGAVRLERTVLDAPVRAVAWHPAGDRIVIGGADGTVAVLAAATLEVVERLDVLGPVSVLRIASDGTSIAVGTDTGFVHLMPASLSAPSVRVPIGRSEVLVTAWSPDGRFVASAGVDGVVRVRRTDGAAVVAELVPGGEVRGIDWSPDGRRLAVAARVVTLYETEGWTRSGSAPEGGGLDWPASVAFGPDGSTLAVLTYEEVRVVASATLEEVGRLGFAEAAGESVHLRRMAWSPSGEAMAVTGEDADLWVVGLDRPGEPRFVRTTTAFTAITAVAYSTDGSMLVLTGPSATSAESRVVVIDALSLSVLHDATFSTGAGPTVAAGFTAGDAWFWAAGAAAGCGCSQPPGGDRDVVKAWSVATGERTFGVEGAGSVGAAAFSHEGAWVLVGTAGGVLSLWAVP